MPDDRSKYAIFIQESSKDLSPRADIMSDGEEAKETMNQPRGYHALRTN
jgi:hypothetical protein